jgi:hypothetical protein
MKLNPEDSLVFVMRQSPNWEALAKDFEAGHLIDPSRYIPTKVKFPPNVASYINIWNEYFPINFFRCRHVLKQIASAQMRNVKPALFYSVDDLPVLQSELAGKNFVLFFYDDDDWYAPDTFEKLSQIDFGNAGIAVFPLIRYEIETYTFVRENEPAKIIVGRRSGFNFRFHTNNYAVLPSFAFSDHLIKLKDHVAASHYANDLGLEDSYFDVLISATNKTPASATSLRLIEDPTGFKRSIQIYIENLLKLSIPDEAAWTVEPIQQTIALFQSVLEEKL